TDLGDHRDLPLRRLVIRVVPREHEAIALDHRVRPQLRLAVDALAVRNVRAYALAVVAPAVERALHLVAADRAALRQVRARRRAGAACGRWASGCGQNASCRWNAPAWSRHKTSSRFQYSSAVTSPGARSLGNATWNQPNGMGKGNLRDAMRSRF